eukprot:10885965-Lingulodinium_polyedra.AAC.1
MAGVTPRRKAASRAPMWAICVISVAVGCSVAMTGQAHGRCCAEPQPPQRGQAASFARPANRLVWVFRSAPDCASARGARSGAGSVPWAACVISRSIWLRRRSPVWSQRRHGRRRDGPAGRRGPRPVRLARAGHGRPPRVRFGGGPRRRVAPRPPRRSGAVAREGFAPATGGRAAPLRSQGGRPGPAARTGPGVPFDGRFDGPSAVGGPARGGGPPRLPARRPRPRTRQSMPGARREARRPSMASRRADWSRRRYLAGAGAASTPQSAMGRVSHLSTPVLERAPVDTPRSRRATAAARVRRFEMAAPMARRAR